MKTFNSTLLKIIDEDELLDFCRKYILHGTPKIFDNSEDQFYEFRKRIATKFEINFYEIYITGSAKMGFSPPKQKIFDYDSDVDVAIVSCILYDKIMSYIEEYQRKLRENRKTVTEDEIKKYHEFLEYGAIGWMRPDLLPTSFRVKELKNDWFKFFDSLSYGKSEVGNYKVTAGVFKSFQHLEKYTMSGLRTLKRKLSLGV